MASENNNSDNIRERKGKAAVEADHDDDHHGHIDLDEVLNEAAHLEAQLALSNLDVTLSELPSTSRAQPAVSLLPDLLNNNRTNETNSESGSDNDDDILEKVKKKLTKLYVGQEFDVILEWMEEILQGLQEVRKELTSLQKDISCKPDSAA